MERKKIAFCGIGSRGDLQPLIALALECKRRNSEVFICSEARIESLVTSFGLEFRRVAGDSTGIIFEPEFAEMLAKGKVFGMMKETGRRKATWIEEAQRDWVRVLDDADLVVSGALCMTETFCVAEKLGVPWSCVVYGPTYPTSEFPLFFVLEKNWFGWLNRLSYNALFWGLWKQEAKRINQWRKDELGLPEMWPRLGMLGVMEERKLLSLGAFHTCMIPTGRRPADWPEEFVVANFFFVPETPESDIDPALRDFLARPGKCVYLGFGSMPAPRPRVLFDLAMAVVSQLGCRAVLCAGWSDLESFESPADLLVIKEAPHDFVFPRVSAIVHHAGAGTCAAALRSGTPSVCCPVMLDQPHNALHLRNLGVGTEPIPFAKLNERVLISAVQRALEDQDMVDKAHALRDEIEAAGSGVQIGVYEIEKLIK